MGINTEIRERLKILKEKLAQAELGGGQEKIDKRHKQGKYTARERILKLVDKDTFVEIDALATHRCVDFNMDTNRIPGDGVVTGYGKIDGRTVYIFSQDFTAYGGALGEVFAQKMVKIMDLAMNARAPVIGINDSGGARIQEGVLSLGGYGDIFYRNVQASGYIPQISAIMGPCAGGAVYSPAMTDFIIMVKKTSNMFITGPAVIKSVTGEEVSFEDLGGATAHATKSGVAHWDCEDEDEALGLIRTLLSYIPSNAAETPPVLQTSEKQKGHGDELLDIVPAHHMQVYDMKKIINMVVDEGSILEVQKKFAPNMVTAFARLDGKPVGILANNPMFFAGCLNINASDKASRFVRFCDCFNIPMVTFVDVPGFLPGTQQEHGGIIRHGAKLLFAYSEATVPMQTVIVRKAYGGAYDAMCSKHLGADMAFAWPSAEIAVMGAEGAANIIHRRVIKEADDPAVKRKEKIKEYDDLFANPYVAASRGYIDAVIVPSETRSRLIAALEAMRAKRELRPPKKHGNIPV